MLPTIEWNDEGVVMIDQRKLPSAEIYVTCKSAKEVAKAIKTMVIRGAPAIGVAAGMGLALGMRRSTATGTKQFATEFHGLEMSVGVVDDLDAALDHVRRYGSGHTEAIVTEDRAAARRFTAEVDAAVVMVNASTRFTDGGEFGFGAEIGISTQKLHARGPMALPELTTTKWVVEGDGQIRV